ncbi:hypothetical protein NP233_g773 [Leucocoprinus birnbaumii]|uniref:Uncharacterized protein n=1 Tax=Leucocoprinus birnbaumii TaxID=56174 RepID=A0AAD5W1Q2_9AGAR|nr:hypothetical protein NP233_g773 [Leucocoprinus birnbaumii]
MAVVSAHPHLPPHAAPAVARQTHTSSSWSSSATTGSPSSVVSTVRVCPLRISLIELIYFLANNRDKVIPLNGLEVTAIQQKVQLLLDSSGAKIKPLKRKPVESTTEAARGIWSGLHADRPAL